MSLSIQAGRRRARNVYGWGLAALVALELSACAQTVYLSEPFSDGSWTNASGGDALGAVWFGGTAGTLSLVDDSAGLGTGTALRLAGSASGQKLLCHFHPATLSTQGDWMRLSLDFRFESAPPSSVWAGLRFGLFNTYLTRTTAEGASSQRNDDVGYGGFISSPAAAGANLGVFSEVAGDDILGGTVGPVSLGSAGESPDCGTLKHSLTLEVRRGASGELGLSAQIDGLTAATGLVTGASSPNYTFDSLALGEGSMAVGLRVDNVSVSASQPDDFERLRLKWLRDATGGSNYNLADSSVQSKLSGIASSANGYWNSLNKGAGRTNLWSSLPDLTDGSDLTETANRLRDMALAYATYGCSLYQNASLGADLVGAFGWYYTNCYNETTTNNDLWNWCIGAPLALQDAHLMVYERLSPYQVASFCRASVRFTPVPSDTGANLAWKARVVGVRAVLSKNYAELRDARDSLSGLFPYVSSSDGFYTDGSFIQHYRHPYTGGYGIQMLANTAPLLTWLRGSAAEVLDPAQTNLFNWVRDSFEPLLYRGANMDMARGREISRSSGTDHSGGLFLVDWIFRVSQVAPPAQAAQMQSLIKYWGSVDTTANYQTHASLDIYGAFRQMMTNPSIATASEPLFHKQFWGMDRVVHTRPGWGLGLSCSSARIYDFESINNENLRAWFTGSGMTYLYNSDLTQYSDAFWPTVDPYRLAGTTVDTTTRADAGGNYLSPARWVGGASLGGTYGGVGMELDAAESTLTAKKSWFMLDDEVVCLGAGINCSGPNPVETTVENRRLNSSGNNSFTANGASLSTSLGWSSNLTGLSWCALSGAGGYYFPAPVSASVVRQARSGSWYTINKSGSAASITRNYLTLWLNHGVQPSNAAYAYVLLPNMAASAVSQYASNPQVSILANSATLQAVRESSLGIVAANFWTDGNQSVDLLSVNKKASVITRENATTLEVGVADPTQTNTGAILVTLNRAASSLLSADAGVTVLQLSPQVQLSVNVNGARGRTRQATFSSSGGVVPPAPTELTAFAGGTQASLTWRASAGAAAYWLKRSLVSGGPYASIGTNTATSYVDEGLAPTSSYYYVVSAVNTNGESLNSAEASTGGVPVNGRALWLRADAGVTAPGGSVSQWADQSGNGRHATQSVGANQPTLVSNGLNGKPVVRFDGVSDYLGLTLPINGLTGLTLVLVSANSASRDPGVNQGNSAPLFWEETVSWGWTYLSPMQTNVLMRFGTTQSGNLFKYQRQASLGGGFSTTVGIHDQSSDWLYINGELVLSAGSKLGPIAGTVTTPYVGRGASGTYFPGDIAEVLVYSNALSATDRLSLENYLRATYLPAQLPVVAMGAPLDGASFITPTNLTLSATVSAGGGSISQVTFFANETLLGLASTAPYSLTWSNVAPGSYSLRARALDSLGAEAFSVPVVVTVSAPLTAPPAPSGLVVSGQASNQVTLSWSDNATNESGYFVERKSSAAQSYAGVALLGANTTVYSDVGLAANTHYFYRVVATNSAGASAPSNEVEASTPALAPLLWPVANQSLVAGARLALTNQALDPNTPAQGLVFSLGAAPVGASIDGASGRLSWRPSLAQAGGSNLFAVVVRQQGSWQTNLLPAADAHVIESFPNANYGSQSSLMVKLSATAGLTRESYLRFDLSGLSGTISQANLRLVPTLVSMAGTHALGLVSNTSWGESTLNWLNKPGSSAVLGTWLPQEGVATQVELSAAVQSALQGDGQFSVRLYATNSTSDGLVYYGSKEGALEQAPLLMLAATGPSLSATQTFWVTVRAPERPVLSLGGRATNGQLGLHIEGDSGPDYTVQVSTNLVDWSTLLSTNSPVMPLELVEPAGALGYRFYRALLGP